MVYTRGRSSSDNPLIYYSIDIRGSESIDINKGNFRILWFYFLYLPLKELWIWFTFFFFFYHYTFANSIKRKDACRCTHVIYTKVDLGKTGAWNLEFIWKVREQRKCITMWLEEKVKHEAYSLLKCNEIGIEGLSLRYVFNNHIVFFEPPQIVACWKRQQPPWSPRSHGCTIFR